MTYEQMMQELDAIPMFGKAAGLKNLSAYLAYLDHPEDSLRVIHVAGTNGKGSVSTFIESILRNAGYSTGLFTSPHLIRINERIRLNFEPCEDQDMADAYEKVKNLIDQRESLSLKMLTYFEVLFLMAMVFFQKKKPDYCIMETGLGGRLDATVLTNPVLSIITSISLDHTAILGNTIEEIAYEKAGIIKAHVPVIVMREQEEAYQVIANVAKEKGAPCYAVRPEDARNYKKNGNSIDFSMENRYYKNGLLCVNSIASYQRNNAMLAALAMHVLDQGISDQEISDGIAKMHWEGRMEQVLPGLFVDGAHNPGAIDQICRTIEEDGQSWNLLFAVCQDKDYHSMIESLSKITWKKIVVTHFYNNRAADVYEIAQAFIKHGACSVSVCEELEKALQDLMQERKEPVLCLGSLYLVGEIKAYCDRRMEREAMYD